MHNQSCVERVVKNAGFFGPFFDAMRLAVVRVIPSRAPVDGLFFSRGPTTIFFAVWTIVIDTINAVFQGRNFSHIGKEVFKGFTPAITHNYSTSSPTWKNRIIGIVATCQHAAINRIFSTVSHAMCRTDLSSLFSFVATAACCMAIAETHSRNYCACSAIAKTIPASMLMFVAPGKILNGEFAESLAGKIFESDIVWDRMNCHGRNLTFGYVGVWSVQPLLPLILT